MRSRRLVWASVILPLLYVGYSFLRPDDFAVHRSSTNLSREQMVYLEREYKKKQAAAEVKRREAAELAKQAALRPPAPRIVRIPLTAKEQKEVQELAKTLVAKDTPAEPKKEIKAPVIQASSDELLTYVTKPGETFSSIAEKYLGSRDAWTLLRDMNPHIKDPNQIPPGSRIQLPEIQADEGK